MFRYDVTFLGSNATGPKPVTALVMQPDRLTEATGVMLFTHGWGGNRFQHEKQMAWAADRFDVVAVGVEYRQSGYDADPVRGTGWCCPYDASFYQVVDVLNALRHVLRIHPQIDRGRLYHYGGSQGGHIALLSAVYAPATFAWVYVSCPVTHLDDHFRTIAGRHFAPYELAARDAVRLAPAIRCPVYLEYGTADERVPYEPHIAPLIQALEGSGRLAHAVGYEGGGHDLSPATTKFDAFQAMAERLPWGARRDGDDDFARGAAVTLDCDGRTLQLDWSRAIDDAGVLSWSR